MLLVIERRGKMGFRKTVVERWKAVGRVLALLAVLSLTFGAHPPHAKAADGAGDHSHFGAACIQAELGKASHDMAGDMLQGHGDCIQLFDPLVQPPLASVPAVMLLAVSRPAADSFRQIDSSFDPPPPRSRG